MDLGLKGRTVAVAAASKGLGRACAEEFAREGADLAICARTEEPLRAAQKELEQLGVRVLATPCDLVAEGACEQFVEDAAREYGRLDVVVSNVGGPSTGAFESKSDDDFRGAIEQNLMTAIRLTRAAVPHMKRAGWGRIVFITSSAAKQPIEGLIIGNTARAGIAGFTKTLSLELAASGITINTVAPGYILTDRQKEIAAMVSEREGISIDEAIDRTQRGIPMRRFGDPRELGALVAFLASERASFITGTTTQIDGGLVRSLF
jgi:3-oxoacyl-[acyl-carrier protein] reductase